MKLLSILLAVIAGYLGVTFGGWFGLLAVLIGQVAMIMGND